MLEAGFTVGPPIDLKEGWNLENQDLFEFLMRLCFAGRIGFLWLGPPCTTYSLARCPKLRSTTQPWGFNVLDPDVNSGNLYLHQSLSLLGAQSFVGGEAVVETPWGAFSRHLPWWKHFAAVSTEVRLDQCRFGMPYMKPTGLLCTSREFAPLGRRCRCTTPHERLEGARTAQAAAYPWAMCLEVAKLAKAVTKIRTAASSAAPGRVVEKLEPEEHELRDHRCAQRFVSHLWSAQLAESLPWKTCGSYRFKRPNHINVLECHAFKTLLLYAPMDHRLLVLQDSMVTLGATAKGRSSSQALNRVLRQVMALQVAKNLYPAGVHCPTWALRADDPSRRRRVRPARVSLPFCFLALKRGRLAEAQDELDASSGTPRSWNRWTLFLSAALLAASGDFTSISVWTATALQPSRPKRFGERPRNCRDCPDTRPVVDGFSAMASGRGPASLGIDGLSSTVPHSYSAASGRVWTHDVRTGLDSPGLCGDHRHSGSKVSLFEELPGRSLEAFNHLGGSLAWKSSSSNASAIVESVGHNRTGLELEAFWPPALDRLLRLTSAQRAHGFDCARLSDGFRDWVIRRDLHQADAGQGSNKGSSHAKCPTRRALRCAFYEELFQSHESLRENLVLLHQPVQS